MKEITKLKIAREQLLEKHFYYNGCEFRKPSSDNKQSEEEILKLTADVLIQILSKNWIENQEQDMEE